MCEINRKIKQTRQKGMETEILKMLSDQIVKLSNETKESIREVKMDLTKHIDNEISHLNGNVKNSQQIIYLKFDDISKQIEEIQKTANERNKILSNDIKELSHENGCPNDLDVEFEKLKESLGPIISIAKYKVLQIMLILSLLIIMLSAFNTFSSMSDKHKQQINNITERVIK